MNIKLQKLHLKMLFNLTKKIKLSLKNSLKIRKMWQRHLKLLKKLLRVSQKVLLKISINSKNFSNPTMPKFQRAHIITIKFLNKLPLIFSQSKKNYWILIKLRKKFIRLKPFHTYQVKLVDSPEFMVFCQDLAQSDTGIVSMIFIHGFLKDSTTIIDIILVFTTAVIHGIIITHTHTLFGDLFTLITCTAIQSYIVGLKILAIKKFKMKNSQKLHLMRTLKIFKNKSMMIKIKKMLKMKI